MYVSINTVLVYAYIMYIYIYICIGSEMTGLNIRLTNGSYGITREVMEFMNEVK